MSDGADAEFADGLLHERVVHFVDFHGVAGGGDEGDGEFAAEVFAEVFETSQYG